MRYKIIIGIVLMLLLIPTAHAIGESKEFVAKKPQYVNIKDWGSNVMNVTLLDYGCTSPTNCYADFEFYNYKDITPKHENLFSEDYDFYFYNLAEYETNIKDLKFYEIKETTQIMQQPVYDICNNGNNTYECIKEYKNKSITSINKEEINYFGDTLKAGTHYIRIEAKRKPNQVIDVIPSFHDVKVNEWFWWNTTYNFRRSINETINFKGIGAVNGSSAVNGTMWIYGQITGDNNETNFLYYVTNYSSVAVANLTDEYYWFQTFPKVRISTIALSKTSNLNQYWVLDNETQDFGSIDEERNLSVMKGNPTAINAVIGKGYSFDYTNLDSFNSSAGGNLDCENHTTCFWFKSSNTSQQVLVSTRDGNFYIGIVGWGGVGLIDVAYKDAAAQQDIRSLDVNYFDGAWHHFCETKDGGTANDITLYVDGINQSTTINKNQGSDGSLGFNYYCIADNKCLHNRMYDGSLDDIRVYNRSLTANEISNIYNSTKSLLGIQETTTTPFTLVLNSPVNQTNTSSSSLLFNCTATDNTNGLNNITLKVYYSNGTVYYTNTTITAVAPLNLTIIDTVSPIPDGSYKWDCVAYNTIDDVKVKGNRTFIIDATKPYIKIDYPQAINYNTNVTDLNYTATDVHGDTCWYSRDGGATNLSFSTFNTNFTSVTSIEGANTWIVYCNDTFGNENSSSISFFKDSINPSVILNSPIESYNSSNLTITFNVTVTDNFKVANVTLYLGGIANETNSSGVNGDYIFIKLLVDGHYNWSILAYDNMSNFNQSVIRNFTIDTSPPEVNVTSPNGTYYLLDLPRLIDLNYTAIDVGVGIDSCWYEYNGANKSLPDCNNTKLNITIAGKQNLTVFANDTANNINSKLASFYVNEINYTQIYTKIVYETQNTTIYLYLNATNMSTAGATLFYNDTNYTYSRKTITATQARFSKSFIVPDIPVTTNISLYWNFTINNEYNNITNERNQTITTLNISISSGAGACGAGASKAAQFYFRNEHNNSATKQDLDYFIKYGYMGNITINGSIDDITDFKICIPTNVNLTVFDDQFYYAQTNYSTRNYYFFEGHILDNITETNILYNLLSDSAKSFVATITSSSGILYDNNIISLMRWYPDEDNYKLVEMEKTNEDGQSVIYVDDETIDYRVVVYRNNGDLIYSTNPFRFVCYSTPCTVDITVYPADINYLSDYNIVSTGITYNSSSRYFVYTYSKNDDRSNLSLEVYLVSSSGDTFICGDSSTDITDILTCQHNNLSGTYQARVYHHSDPNPIASYLTTYGGLFTNSALGLVITAFVTITLVLIFMWNPYLALMGSILGVLFGFVIHSLPLGVVTGVVALAMLIMLVMKKTY